MNRARKYITFFIFLLGFALILGSIYPWIFYQSSRKDILACPPITKEEKDALMHIDRTLSKEEREAQMRLDHPFSPKCHGIYCHNGEWKGKCLYVGII